MNGLKTYLGLLIAAVPTIAQIFGYHTSATFGTDATQLAEQLLQIVGLAFAFYGRAVATVPGFLVKNK